MVYIRTLESSEDPQVHLHQEENPHNLDDFTGEVLSTPKDVNVPDVSIAPRGEMNLLFNPEFV